MITPIYNRQSRTLTSEQYTLLAGDQRLGHLDLHFGASDVYATLVLDRELDDVELAQLIEQIDDDLVEEGRSDFLVRVYVGREVGLFSDEFLRDDYVENGHEEFVE